MPRAITHEARLEGEAAAAMLRAFARSLDPLDILLGSLGGDVYPEGYLEGLRAEWE